MKFCPESRVRVPFVSVVFAFEGQIILSSRIPDFWGEESKTLSQKPVRFCQLPLGEYIMCCLIIPDFLGVSL
jgi:hypothetical protein